MLFKRSTVQLTEIRLDVAGSNQGKLRLGLAVIVATVVVTGSGWPHGDVLQRVLYFVLVAFPCTGIGFGLVMGELIRARAERHGEMRADDREIEAIRARIVDETRGGGPRPSRDARPVARPPRRTPAPPPPPARRSPRGPRQLVAPRRNNVPFRSGYLGLR